MGLIEEKNIKNIFIYAFPPFVGYGINLIILPILTRILTPKDFGIVAFVTVFSGFARSVATLGINFGADRAYFEYREDKGGLNALICSTQLFLYLALIISSLIVFILRNIISRIIIGDAEYGFAIIVGFVAAYINIIIGFYMTYYQNMEKANVYSSFNILQSVFTAVLSLVLVWHFEMSYMGIIYGSLGGAFITCAFIFVHFNRGIEVVFDGRMIIDNIKYGIQILPKSFTGFINSFFDKYLLNNMLSLSTVGIYNIGQTVGNVLFTGMNTIWPSFRPVVYREVFDRGEDGVTSAGRIFTLFAYPAVALALLLILFSQEALYIIAPPEYYEAFDVIIILSFGMATYVFGMFGGVNFAYTKRAYFIFPIGVLGTLVNVGANILLIPRYGLIGAAIATVIMNLLTNALFIIIGQRLYKIQYEWKTIFYCFAILLLAVMTVFYLKYSEVSIYNYYLYKFIPIILYVVVGVKAEIITREKLSKISQKIKQYR